MSWSAVRSIILFVSSMSFWEALWTVVSGYGVLFPRIEGSSRLSCSLYPSDKFPPSYLAFAVIPRRAIKRLSKWGGVRRTEGRQYLDEYAEDEQDGQGESGGDAIKTEQFHPLDVPNRRIVLGQWEHFLSTKLSSASTDWGAIDIRHHPLFGKL